MGMRRRKRKIGRNSAKSNAPLASTIFALFGIGFLGVGLSWADAHLGDTAQGAILLAGALVFGIVIVRAGYIGRPTSGLIHSNGNLEDRIRNNLLFFGHAETSIIIVTGRLFSAVYDSPRILELFDRLLSDSVDVTVYITTTDTVDSTDFVELLQKHNAQLISVPGAPLRHGAIVDARHVKLEKRGVSDFDRHKDVTYYMFHRQMAHAGLMDIQKGLPVKALAEPLAA